MITGATIGFYLLAIVAILASLRVITVPILCMRC